MEILCRKGASILNEIHLTANALPGFMSISPNELVDAVQITGIGVGIVGGINCSFPFSHLGEARDPGTWDRGNWWVPINPIPTLLHELKLDFESGTGRGIIGMEN